MAKDDVRFAFTDRCFEIVLLIRIFSIEEDIIVVRLTLVSNLRKIRNSYLVVVPLEVVFYTFNIFQITADDVDFLITKNTV